MFVRFVQVRVKPEHLQNLRTQYEKLIIPVLEEVPGCLFVGLIQNNEHPDDCISLTLWSSQENATSYVNSGTYDRLIQSSQPYFADAEDWQIRLSEDLALTYSPVPSEPLVQAFSVSSRETPRQNGNITSPFIRIVSLQIDGARKQEFTELYDHLVIPALRKATGCRQAYLIENTGDPEKYLSMTIWENRENAIQYEQSGAFNSLLDKLRPLFSGVYQWKLQLQREPGVQVVSTADIAVDGYTVLASRNFPQ